MHNHALVTVVLENNILPMRLISCCDPSGLKALVKSQSNLAGELVRLDKTSHISGQLKSVAA